MKLEQQVCSLGLAKKLKELGVKQESYFFWWVDRYGVGTDNNAHVQDHEPNNPKDGWRVVSAFTVAELGEMLPLQLMYHYDGRKADSYLLDTRQTGKKGNGAGGVVPSGWYIRYYNRDLKATIPSSVPFLESDTEADARSKMLVYLLENNLLPKGEL